MKAVVAVMLLCIACGDPTDPGSDPNTIALDRRFDRFTCDPLFNVYGPCSWGLGHGDAHVDSAHLILRPDHTGEWMVGTSGHYNACYIDGKDCTTPTKSVIVVTGTYSFAHDTMYLSGSQGREIFFGTVSTRVSPTWSGPDSLTWRGGPLVTIHRP